MWHTLTHRGTYTHHSTYSIQAQRLKDTNTTPMHLHTHTHTYTDALDIALSQYLTLSLTCEQKSRHVCTHKRTHSHCHDTYCRVPDLRHLGYLEIGLLSHVCHHLTKLWV